ncbi:MarR family winged helix-turn-helix transcriptional regulator [Ancylobacter terrae]|uniref:MarR family winged helix-turn-helix transcriptional regulator n=1 Tax=Ancylobacter sp. sgz301288 TaxID=3342077 RepID=UPI0038593D92
MLSPCYCTRLRAAGRRIAAIYDAALEPLGINVAQFALLRMIERRQKVSLTELGRVAELDRSTMGRNVRVLERLGLAAAGRGEDQRESVVTLTAAGAELLIRAAPLWEACQRTVEARLGPERIEALDELLQAV